MSFEFASYISQMTLNELALRAYYATLVFIPVYIGCRLLRQRLPYLQLTLWSLVLIRALMPSSFSLPFSLRSVMGQFQNDSAAGLGDSLRCLTTDDCSSMPGWLLGSGSMLVVGLWGLLAAYAMGQLLLRRHRFRTQMLAASPTGDPRLLRLVAQWCQHFHISRSVELRIGNEGMPFTMGWCRPRIHLPQAIAAADLDSARIVIGHEMAHIKRLDDLWVLLCGLTAAVYFFLPPLRHAVRRLNLQRERVCDQLVISSGLVDAAEYAHQLLNNCTEADMRNAVVPGLSAHAAMYASRCAAISEAAAGGLRGVPVALCTLVGAMLFVMPMRPVQSVPVYSDESVPVAPGEFVRPVDSHRYAARHGEALWGGLLDGSIHTGVDFIVPAGAPVAAIADGTVERRESRIYTDSAACVYLTVRHGAFLAYYTYLDQVNVQPGDHVTRGQVLGLLHDGPPPQAHKGTHLHFEVTRDGVSVDPLKLLPR